MHQKVRRLHLIGKDNTGRGENIQQDIASQLNEVDSHPDRRWTDSLLLASLLLLQRVLQLPGASAARCSQAAAVSS